MAEESDLEKTEPASPRRLEKAREEGDVPRSRELATCTILLAAGAGMWMLGDRMIAQISRTVSVGLTLEREHAFDIALLLARSAALIGELLIAFAPMALLLIVVALASPALIGGWLFSTKSLMPNFGKLNPIKGLGNMVSSKALVELLKAIGKTLLVGGVAWIVITSQIDAVMGLAVQPFESSSPHLGQMLLKSFLFMVSALVLIALIIWPEIALILPRLISPELLK